MLEPTGPAAREKGTRAEQSVLLLMFWEEQARTAGSSLQVQCGLGQAGASWPLTALL